MGDESRKGVITMGLEPFALLRDYLKKSQALDRCDKRNISFYRILLTDKEDIQFEVKARAEEMERVLREEFYRIPRGISAKDPLFSRALFIVYTEWLSMVGALPEKNRQNLADLVASAKRILAEET
ncbi:MAG: hypothetical protein PHD72_00560 [Patescibacteria group bacterium]|nr:hypothetical protein [Patescibacteria group bacterium]